MTGHQQTRCSIIPNVLFTMYSISHVNGCRSALYSKNTVMCEDPTWRSIFVCQDVKRPFYFTWLVARHLIKMLNVLMDDRETCMKRNITQSVSVKAITAEFKLFKQPCLIEALHSEVPLWNCRLCPAGISLYVWKMLVIIRARIWSICFPLCFYETGRMNWMSERGK